MEGALGEGGLLGGGKRRKKKRKRQSYYSDDGLDDGFNEVISFANMLGLTLFRLVLQT